jgi:hypothetical protein
MAQSKIVRLVISLAEKTDRNELQWEPTAEEEVFQVSFPHYSVQIRLVENFASATPDGVLIVIRNKEGLVIDQVSDVDLQKEWSEAYSVMSGIYGKARRKALGVDKALDELLKELGEDDWLK